MEINETGIEKIKKMLDELVLDDELVEKIEILKKGGWLKKAINPKHKGYCTPMTKKTCTPHRKALAKRFKSGEFRKK